MERLTTRNENFGFLEMMYDDNDNDNDNDNDVREKFYKQYGYELDEQPKEVQYLSLYEINPLCWKVWICDVFGTGK